MSRSTLNYVNIKIDVSLHLFMKAIMASSMTIFGGRKTGQNVSFGVGRWKVGQLQVRQVHYNYNSLKTTFPVDMPTALFSVSVQLLK